MKGAVRRLLYIALLLVLSASSLAVAQTPKPGGTLKVAWEADVTGLDPYLSPGVQAWHTVGNLFSSLVTVDTNLNSVPDLAESWDILENGKVYVFHLRKGVTFHEGSDFDAEVVRWNYQRAVDPDEDAFIAPFLSIMLTVSKSSTHTRSNSLSNTPPEPCYRRWPSTGWVSCKCHPRPTSAGARMKCAYIPTVQGRSSSASGSRTASSSSRGTQTTSNQVCRISIVSNCTS